VNGRRYIFSGVNQVTDINTIPAALVERVEIVTGGSTAVYGSDAIAGATNFILRSRFDGIEVRGQLGGDTRGDALSRSADVTLGTNFAGGNGNLAVAFDYFERGGILQGDRQFSRDTLDDGRDADGRPVLVSRGSGQTPNGAFSNVPSGAALNDPLRAGLSAALAAAGLSDIGSAGFTFDGIGSAPRPFLDPADRFNFAPDNYLQIPALRYGASAFLNADMADALTLYGEAAYYRNETDIQLAPSNLSAILPIEVDNPFLSPELQNVFRELDLLETGANQANGLANVRIARRFSEVGPRQALTRRDSFRAGGGIRGEIGNLSDNFLSDMAFDISYFYSSASTNTKLNNLVSRSVLTDGLVRSAPGTNPLVNPFGAGSISDEAALALQIDTTSKTRTRLHALMASMTSDVTELPAGPLKMALGSEFRSAFARSAPDPALASGDGVGFSSFQPTKGTVNVFELFGELRAPILAPASPIGELTANAGFRYSDYDLAGVGGVWTYLGGLTWSPTPDLQFRGQFQRAVRAPNIGELFGGQSNDRPRATDPCATPAAATDTALRDLCIATGVPAASVGNPALQPEARIDSLTGGNPDLGVETSDTYTVGVAFTPQSHSQLRVSVDYFNIEVKNAIAPLAGGVDSVLDLCFNVIRDVDSAVCRAVQRNPVDGIIAAPFSVLTFNSNIGALETSGIDIGLGYNFTLPWALIGPDSTLVVDARGTWVNDFSISPLQDLPDQVNECVGAFGLTCGEVRPRYKTASRISWENGPLTLSVRHRFLSSVTDDRILIPQRSGLSGPAEADLAAPVLASQNYVDFSFDYKITSLGANVYGGINNAFDKKPPIAGAAQQQANTYPSTFEALGPEFFIGLRVKY
jgi:outer membrane receptor protein involved in Fe transport